MKVLLIEDERALSEALCTLMRKQKIAVEAAYDGAAGLDAALSDRFDVILLDLMLPKMNGLEVLKNLRSSGIATPVLLLTAKGEVADKVRGLDEGADDYLPKPFATEELFARVRALTRRKGEPVLEPGLVVGDLTLDFGTLILTGPKGEVQLTLKEFEILKLLMERPQHVMPKDDIIISVWGYDAEVEHNTLEVYISFLRKKLSFLESGVSINALRGVGYRLGMGD
ncbi:response regulator transcription factor [Acidaminobacter hydrogenoformans]|uniref:Stage 0 sporulation protein A homolog n=1 Tax=Acidaminobacter hydrogenoformans DSM 2784 TaxID=1120920 RepID=A0A1G5RZB7_9FIRM|nr:response regulator transcription factor [Acidaminobacter hydrogenoformans]SCZ79346.1 DNA-binding response regulator, OmpR family, contains REC and winged-helix (wHTH) domain [Acidaminobacter hydrogenoformans DSM 2784]